MLESGSGAGAHHVKLRIYFNFIYLLIFYKEFDHPHILLKDKESFLSKMVEHTGKATSELLYNIAKDVSIMPIYVKKLVEDE